MKTLIFGGYSDDTFGEITPRGDDYDNCASGAPIEWLLESASAGQAMLVVGQFCPGHAGGWLVGVSTWDPSADDVPLPDWPMRLRPRPDVPYSPALEIDVPDDIIIRCLQRGEED